MFVRLACRMKHTARLRKMTTSSPWLVQVMRFFLLFPLFFAMPVIPGISAYKKEEEKLETTGNKILHTKEKRDSYLHESIL